MEAYKINNRDSHQTLLTLVRQRLLQSTYTSKGLKYYLQMKAKKTEFLINEDMDKTFEGSQSSEIFLELCESRTQYQNLRT